MKSYEEMTESVLKRRDNYISEKKIRMKKLKELLYLLYVFLLSVFAPC